jgi:lysozyme family protein
VALLRENDGQDFHVTLGDAGGATREGITFRVFQAWRTSHSLRLPSIDDFKDASASELQDLRHAWFWLSVAGDELPVGVDLIAFEVAYGSGPGWAARLLKRALGWPEDFRMDQATVTNVRFQNAASLVQRYSAEHRAYVAGLAGAHRFGVGWARRINHDETIALSWINSGAPDV